MIDISFEEYLCRGGVSNSSLGYLLSCPRLFQKYVLEKRMREQTAAQIIGSATHCAVFEPERFKQDYIIGINVKRTTSAGKELHSEFQEKHKDKTILDPKDFHEVEAMAESVRDSCSHLLDGIKAEQSIFWRDDDTDIECKARIDAVAPTCLLDLKTTKNASPDDFSKSIAQYSYYRQAAFYLDGYNKVTGHGFDKFIFIAVEKTYPYLTAIYDLDHAALNLGRSEYKQSLATLKHCKQNNYWPGYSREIQTLSLPRWKAPSQIKEKEIVNGI